MKRVFLIVLILTVLAVMLVRRAGAFVLAVGRWPSPQTTMYVLMDEPWNSSFIAAMGLWNSSTVFTFAHNTQFADPCSTPNTAPAINGVKFSDTVCGTAWGSNVLAVTISWWSGGAVRMQSGVVFNSSYQWGVYDGPYATGVWSGIQDFQRVAVHELGHVIGLDHEDSVPAIMATAFSYGSTITRPQEDDIAGVNVLFGGASTDSTGPALVIASHFSGQNVSTSSILLTGTATDAGRGGNGIASVTVNGARANGDNATGSGTADWSQAVALNPGANPITIIATDSSPLRNTTTVSINITRGDNSSPTANTYHVFPQFADGRFGDNTYYRTTLMISNPSASQGAACALQLHGFTVPGFGLNNTIGPGGWLIASTNGAQVFQSGYATLQCSASVEAQLLYSYYSSAGAKISEATVFSSPPASIVKVLADEREDAHLGLAIANDSDQTTTYTISVTGASGAGSVTLAPRSATAKFINQLVSGIPPSNVGQVVVSSSNGTASIIGLRYTGGIFTTVPESIRSSVGPTAATNHIFPQFADGKFSDGTYYRSTRMYINPNSSTTADCTTHLYGLTINGLDTFTSSLTPGASLISPSSGAQAFQSGYAALQCSVSVDAQVVYAYYTASGAKLGEATVFSSPSASRVQILADAREGARVGLAIANDSDQSNTYTIEMYDGNDILVGSASRNLAARRNLAAFVDEFAPLPPEYVGRVIVSSTTGTASIIGLRFTGANFTTIPATVLR